MTVHVNTGSLAFHTARGESFDLLGTVTSLERAGAVRSWPVTVVSGDGVVSGRVCALRKTWEAVRMAHERLQSIG